MLKLSPIKSEKIWGYENWIASVYPSQPQKDFLLKAGKDFPLLVKVIQANDTLSVQVHPDDKDAFSIEGQGFRGKTECWYVLDAQKDARLVYGLKKNGGIIFSSDEIRSAIENESLDKMLNFVSVKKGDFIFIPAGTVHAIGKGLRLLEVQQSCDLTYRMYDWGRGREVHIEKSLKVIKQENAEEIKPFAESFDCEYFSLEKKNFSGAYSFLVSNKSRYMNLVFVSDGTGSVKSSSGEKFNFEKENIFAFEPGEKITFEGSAELIKIIAK